MDEYHLDATTYPSQCKDEYYSDAISLVGASLTLRDFCGSWYHY